MLNERSKSSSHCDQVEEIEAVACAVQNMHLTATARGLGAYWSTSGCYGEVSVGLFYCDSLYIYTFYFIICFFVELCLSAPYVLHNSHFDCAERQDMRAFLKLRQDERCLGFFFVGRSALPQLPRAYRGAIEEKIEWWE